MTREESKALKVGARVFWNDDKNDAGTVVRTDWSCVTIKWDNRGGHDILHNDMAGVTVV
ncbi:MAG: hypothetical protein JWR80_4593 [Bradyrhizobium sp.]|nr:hypothetical protein [Bradyrhizobium sp.]